MATSLFQKGLKANYTALETKSATTIYFTTDTRELFLGEALYTDPVRFYTEDLPATPAQDVLYFNTETGAGSAWNGTAWVVVIKGTVTDLSETVDDTTIPTSKAVKDYVGEAIDEALDAYTPPPGSGSGEGDVNLDGVAYNVTYDEETATLTVPQVGKTTLVVHFPVVDPEAFASAAEFTELQTTVEETVTIVEEAITWGTF
jgi:hypothetical protein